MISRLVHNTDWALVVSGPRTHKRTATAGGENLLLVSKVHLRDRHLNDRH